MKTYLLLLFLLPLTLFAQKEEARSHWKLQCDTLSDQMEMNRCSRREVQLADSTMDTLYRSTINYMKDYYAGVYGQYKDKADPDALNRYKELHQSKLSALMKSQEHFKAYLENTHRYIEMSYEGNVVKSMAADVYALELIEKRIKVLKNIEKGLAGSERRAMAKVQ